MPLGLTRCLASETETSEIGVYQQLFSFFRFQYADWAATILRTPCGWASIALTKCPWGGQCSISRPRLLRVFCSCYCSLGRLRGPIRRKSNLTAQSLTFLRPGTRQRWTRGTGTQYPQYAQEPSGTGADRLPALRANGPPIGHHSGHLTATTA